MNLKSFFDLEKVVFNKEELEAPYEDKPTDVIFIRENQPYENHSHKNEPTNPIVSRENLQK